MNAEEYIKGRLESQISWYDDKATKMQRAYKFWQAVKLVFALAIPIVALFMSQYPECIFWWSITIAILSAFIILIEGLQKLYDYKDLWKKYRLTSEALSSQKILFQTQTGSYSKAKDSFKLLVERCEQLMSEEQASWDELMEDTED
ncbi:DUF4231 domain-containing protein [Crocinitomix catalasitica]|nr:DUF4231 domain-containing protein [Crocinitomix catalasitica]